MNQRPWKWWAGVAVAALPLLTACDRQQQGSQSSAQGQMPPSEVATVVVQPQRVVLTSELPGRTSGYLVAEIRPQVSGLIQKRLFEEGVEVQAGQVLYQIDPSPFQVALDNALANVAVAEKSVSRAKAALIASEAGVKRQLATLDLAKINRQRMEDLFKEKAVATSQRDQAVTDAEVAEASLRAAEAQVETDRQAIAVAEATIQQAQASVAAAKIDLGYTQITAPIAGRIGRSAVTPGAIVTAYQATALATIQQFNPIYVDVPQSTSELLRLKRRLEQGKLQRQGGEDQVSLILEDGSTYPSKGTLQFREVTVDPTTGSVILRMVFDNANGVLLPGMFTRAVIQEGINEKAILIPQQAVSRDGRGEPLALVVADGKAAVRKLVLDRTYGDQWLVSSGIAAGDHLIVEGVQKVRPGAPVTEMSWKAPAKQPQPSAEPGANTQKSN
ncbi:MAG: efflux RND transporter periplasmic adaptor subunit [Phycisphaerales bacterium]|nr:efflux RND transporter periplasmic adaptor subunit [Phycisphaerales bacterium]